MEHTPEGEKIPERAHSGACFHIFKGILQEPKAQTVQAEQRDDPSVFTGAFCIPPPHPPPKKGDTQDPGVAARICGNVCEAPRCICTSAV